MSNTTKTTEELFAEMDATLDALELLLEHPENETEGTIGELLEISLGFEIALRS